MFVRSKKIKLKDGGFQIYAYLVENQWNPIKKKVEQKQIACLGNVLSLPHNSLIEKIILALDRFAKLEGFSSLSEGIIFDNLSDEDKLKKTYDWGIFLLASHLLKTLSLERIIVACFKEEKEKKVNLQKLLTILTTLLAYQLQGYCPVSERGTLGWYKTRVFLPKKLSLLKDDFYRALDFLIKNKEEIEKEYYLQNQNLFNQGLELVLFDTTSIYYWGQKGEAATNAETNLAKTNLDSSFPQNSLLQYGFSKDKRGDLKQLIIGLVLAEDLSGNPFPVAHETFPGNQLDLLSFPQIINKVKDKYKITKIIFVADKGMVSEENLRQLEENQMEYILGVRIRKLSSSLKKALIKDIEKDQMERIKDNLYSKEFKLDNFLRQGKKGEKIIEELTTTIYKNLDFYRSHTGDEKKDKENIRQRLLKRRYFVCFNPYVAQDNKIKRESFKKIIKDKIKYTQDKQWVVKNGYKKYLKFEGGINPVLDEEKLETEKDYDGKWILVTNSQTVSPQLAAIRYKTLRVIEQGFKDLKSFLKVRPIYHFKESRIKAHIFVSFLTLVLKWYLCQRLDSISQTTGRRFLEEINNLKAIEVDEKVSVFVRTALSEETISNLKKLQMEIPPKVLLDQRRKPKIPPRKSGRPKTQSSPNQQALPQFP